MRQLGSIELSPGNGFKFTDLASLPEYAAINAGISTSLLVVLTVPFLGSNGRPAYTVPLMKPASG